MNGQTLRIIQNTANRGYYDGWTPGQMYLRQIVIAIEEACELLLATPYPITPEFVELKQLAETLRGAAKSIFTNREMWREAEIYPSQITPAAMNEKADLKVVIANLEYSFRVVTGADGDFWTDAERKSAGDVRRGVSYQEKAEAATNKFAADILKFMGEK